MKSLFFVSVAFSLLSGTPLSAGAQKSLNFMDGIELSAETGASDLAISAPVSAVHNTKLLTKAEDKRPAETERCTSLQFKYALLLNREVESITNTALYTFIDEWYGTRYRYGGTSKKGIDCSSLTEKLMKAVYSIDIPRTAHEQYAACTKIPESELMEGDLVFFNTRGGVSHVGFYLGDGYFLQASSSNGVTISNMDEPYFSHRFIGGGRITPPSIDYSKILL